MGNEYYLSLGNRYFREKNFIKAIQYFELASKQYPNMADILKFNIELAKKNLGESNNDVDFLQFNSAFIKNENVQKYDLRLKTDTIDIIVPVYNALTEVQQCLKSLKNNTEDYKVRVIVVNDGSDEDTTIWLRDYCERDDLFLLIENQTNQGYTKTVNIGLRKSNADYIVTLNSDTIVTRGWLSGLLYCFETNTNVGVVGPLSNAASYQTVPILFDDDNNFLVNDLPKGWTADDMATVIRLASKRIYPEVPIANGFCFMFKREVLNTVGYLDEVSFPTGYGEENDYCIRITNEGFRILIADDTYVFHSKSKSFGHDKRMELSKRGSNALKEKYGKPKIKSLSEILKNSTALNEIRNNVANAISKIDKFNNENLSQKRILFLLPVSGGGGGVHSIVQETIGMIRLGLKANIAVPKKHLGKFLDRYDYIRDNKAIFLPFEEQNLIELSYKFDIVIGTIYTSMKLVKKIVEKNKGIQPAYYIQDYEPLFEIPNSVAWIEARQSYTLVPNTILMAKTMWLCNKVYDEHRMFVKKVSPSIDHDIYKPNFKVSKNKSFEHKKIISAMIRPKTPRRGAERTMQVLKLLHDRFGHDIHIEIFGCSDEELKKHSLYLDFPFVNNGELNQLGVASILQKTDYFIDLSDYQAFGRTGLEAMACGAFVILTKFGGVYEYAVHGVNAMLVNPFDMQEVYDTLVYCIENIKVDKINQIKTASYFTINKASISEVFALTHYFEEGGCVC